MNFHFTFYKNNSAKIRVFFKTCLLFFVLCFTVPFYMTGQVKTTTVTSKTIKTVPTTVTTKEMIMIYYTDATCKFSVTGMNFPECGVCYFFTTYLPLNREKKTKTTPEKGGKNPGY